MKISLPITVLVLSIAIFVTSFLLSFFYTRSSVPKSVYKKANLKIQNVTFSVDIADTPGLRMQGLSGRKKLGDNEGMIFLFPVSGFYRFWMKDMNFPLDFVWVNGEKIIDTMEKVPVPPAGIQLPTYTSKSPADKILEIKAGAIKKNNIRIGDSVNIEYL